MAETEISFFMSLLIGQVLSDLNIATEVGGGGNLSSLSGFLHCERFFFL